MAKSVNVTIGAPKFKTVSFTIRGTAPYVQNKFSNKAREQMKETQMAGPTGKKGKKREAKDFQACYEAALHRATGGQIGIPAPGFRAAMISACRLVGFQMTKAKLAFFVEADDFDNEDGTPLVLITKGEPIYHEAAVRNETGVPDIRPRPMWKQGWEAEVRIKFDEDMFTVTDVANLLLRAGLQVGIGEGRPDSKKSCGMGWGTFEIVEDNDNEGDKANE